MRKFGIELEVAGISKEQATEALNAAGIETVAENYNHRTRNYWKATTDSSIRSDNGLSCELVSPPLPYRDASFVQIAKVVAVLKEIGATVNDSCGMHIHVDCRGINDPDFYRLLLTFYSKFENEIDMFVHANRRENANNYCRTNKSLYNSWEKFWSEYADLSPTFLTELFSTVERYHKLNFASFVRHGTVEFRQYQGTLNINDIRAWVDFCITLVEHTAACCANAANKRALRGSKKNQEYVAPKTTDYITAFSEKIREKTNSAAEVVSSWHTAHTAFPRYDAELWPLLTNKSVFFSKKDINLIFKLYFQLSCHLAVRVDEVSNEARHNQLGTNAVFRDTNFTLEPDFPLIATAFFFGYNGTEKEIKRKAQAKLANLGLYKNGHIIASTNEFIQYFEWLVDRNNVPQRSVGKNAFYKFFQDRSVNRYHQSRKLQIASFCNNFIENSKRYFVSNPRNLRSVINGTFSRHSFAFQLATFMAQTKQHVYAYCSEADFAYYAHESNPPLSRFISSKTRTFNRIVDFLEGQDDEIYNLLDSRSSYVEINKQPFFEFVDSIRRNEAIASTFVGLADTSKISFVGNNSLAATTRDIENAIYRVRELIEQKKRAAEEEVRAIESSRQNNRTRQQSTSNRRIYTNLSSDIAEISEEIRGARTQLSSNTVTTLERALNGESVDIQMLTSALTEFESVVRSTPSNSTNVVGQTF